MKYILISLNLLLISCGSGTQTLQIEAPEDDIISGESYNYVIIRMEFITDIRKLCEDLYIESEFDNLHVYRQTVAECTFDKLSILNLDAINNFNDQVCENPQTPEEIEICDALN